MSTHDDITAKFGNTPLTDADTLAQARAFADRCEELADDRPTAYAEDTLLGIAATVRKTGVITEAQRTAVHNIVRGAERREHEDRFENRHKRSRRYEGF